MDSNQIVANEYLELFIRRNRNLSEILVQLATLAIEDKLNDGRQIIKERIPFVPVKNELKLKSKILYDTSLFPKFKSLKSKLKIEDKHKVYTKDNYHCRYSGIRMFSPGFLSFISSIYQEHLPFQYPNGKYSETHIIMWDLYASPDHIIPRSQFETHYFDNPENLICASATLNMLIKKNTPLDILGWEIKGNQVGEKWYGGLDLVKRYLNTHNDYLKNSLNKNHEELKKDAIRWANLF